MEERITLEKLKKNLEKFKSESQDADCSEAEASQQICRQLAIDFAEMKKNPI